MGFKIFGVFFSSHAIFPTWNEASQGLGADIAVLFFELLSQNIPFFLSCTPLAAPIPSSTAPLLIILFLQALRNSKSPPAIPFGVAVLYPQLLQCQH